ncbi:hypothetical protein ACWC3X_44725 [Streptomyces populi]
MITRVHKAAGMLLVAACAVSGCGGTESEGAKHSPGPAPTANSDSPAGTRSTQAAGDEAEPPLDGDWVYLAPISDLGSSARLLIDGQQVKLGDSQHQCHGKASKEDGLYVLRLKCDDGNTDRTVGRVHGLSWKSMTVDWEGFGAETFRQTKPAVGRGE